MSAPQPLVFSTYFLLLANSRFRAFLPASQEHLLVNRRMKNKCLLRSRLFFSSYFLLLANSRFRAFLPASQEHLLVNRRMKNKCLLRSRLFFYAPIISWVILDVIIQSIIAVLSAILMKPYPGVSFSPEAAPESRRRKSESSLPFPCLLRSAAISASPPVRKRRIPGLKSGKRL